MLRNSFICDIVDKYRLYVEYLIVSFIDIKEINQFQCNKTKCDER